MNIFQMLPRSMKGAYTIKYQPIFNISFLDIRAVLAKVKVHNAVS